MTGQEFTKTLTKEQQEYIQERYEKQLEEAIEHFQTYEKSKSVSELVEYRKKMYAASWFKSLAECKTSHLQNQASKYWVTGDNALLELDNCNYRYMMPKEINGINPEIERKYNLYLSPVNNVKSGNYLKDKYKELQELVTSITDGIEDDGIELSKGDVNTLLELLRLEIMYRYRM